MGYGGWSHNKFASYSSSIADKSALEVYARRSSTDKTRSGQEVNADHIEFRESCDSDEHPLSTPVMIGLDVTGSMEFIPDVLVKDGLGVFVKDILQRKIITDPHLLFMAIGDAVAGDSAPLQVTQFESDNRIVDQLTDLWLEKGGGGNCYESYDLAWAFAAYKTRIDCYSKRQQKGFLFTVGDEEFPQQTSSEYFKRVFGQDNQVTPQTLLTDAQKQWYVYHIVIAEGAHVRRYCLPFVLQTWTDVLGKRAIPLLDYTKLPQLLSSVIALENHVNFQEVMSWWDDNTQAVLMKALNEQ